MLRALADRRCAGVAIVALSMLNLAPIRGHAQGVRERFREVHLGMEVRLELVGDRDRLASLARLAFDRIDTLDAVLSDWRMDSDLRRLESASIGAWVPVRRELAVVLATASAMARASEGAFDPTIGPLTRLWREAQRTGKPISAIARREARARVDYRAYVADSVRNRVLLKRSELQFDLGAIAKGFILDQIIVLLTGEGLQAALVEAGGDLAVFTSAPTHPPWRVRVPRGAGDTVLTLRDGTVSTSGASMQSLSVPAGRGESHVMRPTTGIGLRDGQQVTVMGARAVLTDAVATAVTLLPRAKGSALARGFGVQIIAREVVPPVPLKR